jgi:hypothetical protein
LKKNIDIYIHGNTKPTMWCAKWTRIIIEETYNVKLERHENAKEYGSSLLKLGFKVV